MLALYAHGEKDLRLEPAPETPLAPGELRLAMRRGGICGSDLHYYHHGGFGTVRIKAPMILGHEVSGEVVEVGDRVEGFSVGDLVAVSPSLPCRGCRYCLAGLPNHCENMLFYGSAMRFPHVQGGFRQMLVAKASRCAHADGLDAGEAAMAEPLSVALHAVGLAGEMIGRRVLITGAGPIGALCVLAARRAGAEEIVITDLIDAPLEIARRLGADAAFNVVHEPDALAPWREGKGRFDVLFECAGAEAALRSGVDALAPRGVIVQVGLGGDITVPMQQITAKELSLRGSFRFHDEFFTAVSLMRKRLIDVAPLITHSYPLADYEAAFTMATDRGQAMKVQLDLSAC